MFCFVPPQESVVVPQFYLDTLQWFLSTYVDAQLLGWISHDGDKAYWTISSESHNNVTPLILFHRDRKIDSTQLNKFTCDSEYYKACVSHKEKKKRKEVYFKEPSNNELSEIQKLVNTNLLHLWNEKPYLIYMIGNDDADKAKSFRSKEEANQWIEDVVKSGVCDSYSDFEILEEDLLYN